jgi:hypothetical protein
MRHRRSPARRAREPAVPAGPVLSAICLAYDGDASGAANYAVAALTSLTSVQRQGIITARASEAFQALPAPQQAMPVAREIRELIALSSDTSKEEDQ